MSARMAWKLCLVGLLGCFMGSISWGAYYPGTPARFVPGAKPGGLPAYIQLTPYNTGFQAPNLWRIEQTRQALSPAILSPDGSRYVFTETTYLPGTRQVTATLFEVEVPPLPLPGAPTENPESIYSRPDPRLYTSWFRVEDAGRRRRVLWRVGDDRPETFAFQTLVPIDWSANGERLLIKRQEGVLYTGLRTSDVLVLDREGNRLIQYGEIARAVQYHWQQRGANPAIFRLAWDLQPLGWEPGSNERFYVKAWAFSQQQAPVSLGLWHYDITTRQPKLVTEAGTEAQPMVAANGWAVQLPDPLTLQNLMVPANKPTNKKPWDHFKRSHP